MKEEWNILLFTILPTDTQSNANTLSQQVIAKVTQQTKAGGPLAKENHVEG